MVVGMVIAADVWDFVGLTVLVGAAALGWLAWAWVDLERRWQRLTPGVDTIVMTGLLVVMLGLLSGGMAAFGVAMIVVGP